MIDTLQIYLIVSAILLNMGIFAVVTRKNAVAILMGIELILNSANINFVAFNRFGNFQVLDGHVFSIFVIVLAAAEAAVFLAIILSIYREFNSISPNEVNTLKG